MLIQRYVRLALSALLVGIFLLHVAKFLPIPFLHQMENLSYDVRLNLMLPDSVDRRIVIIDLDERSLAEVGRWPWGRDVMARMVNNLFDEYKIKLLAFDIVFAESDESSGLGVLNALADGPLADNQPFLSELNRLRPQLQNDRLYAESLKGKPVIMGYFFKTFSKDNEESPGLLPAPVGELAEADRERIPLVEAQGYGANLSLLQENAFGGGFFDNPLVDSDGIFRRVPLMQQYQGQLYESLSLATARAALGSPPLQMVVGRDSKRGSNYVEMESLRIAGKTIPVDRQGAALVPYRGRMGSFPYVSAIDVLSGNAPDTVRETLKNAICLVGTTAAGLLDLRSTPVQNAYAGVEVHANLVSGILDDRIMQRPAYIIGYEFALLVIVGLIMTLLIPRLSPTLATGLSAAILVAVLAGTLLVWKYANFVLPLATPVTMIAALFVFHAAYGYFMETRGKRQLAKLFGQYVPPELVDEMNTDPSQFSLEGESREMTVLFSDVRGFTTLSEGLDPKQLTQLMNEFLTPMTHVIHQHRGTIDKYMGDAIMAFWGAPLTDSEHERHALQTAMSMIEALKVLQAEFRLRRWPPINVGIGINSGTMSVGNMGSEFRMAYTVMGDAVNLGSRLEGLTKIYAVDIIVSESIKNALPEYVFTELDKVKVKGKDLPVSIFEPAGLDSEVDKAFKSELKRYQRALAQYRAQQWDSAERELFALTQANPERQLYRLYLDRIAHFRSNPPAADWDGVVTFETK